MYVYEGYRHLSSPPPVPSFFMFKGLKLLPIVAGLITDIMISVVLGFLWAGLLYSFLSTNNMFPIQAGPDPLAGFAIFWIGASAMGAIGSLLGGFLTGSLVKSDRVKNGFAMSLLSSAMEVFVWKYSSLLYSLIEIVLTVGPATLGAYFAQRFFARRAAHQ